MVHVILDVVDVVANVHQLVLVHVKLLAVLLVIPIALQDVLVL